MSEELSFKYGEYTIEYQMYRERWAVKDSDGTELKADFYQVGSAKDYCDNREKRLVASGKAKKEFRQIIYSAGYGDGLKFGKARVCKKVYGRPTTTVTGEDGKRQDVSLDSCTLRTPENEATMAQISALRKEADELRDKATDLWDALPKLQPEDLEEA